MNLKAALIDMCTNYASWDYGPIANLTENNRMLLKKDLNSIHEGLGDWFEINQIQMKESN